MKIRLQRYRGAYVGAIDMTCANVPGRVSAIAVGATRADALAKAALVAERIASDPVMAEIIPPQAMAAIKVAKGLASAARRGLPTLRRAWSFLSPKGKKLAAQLAQDLTPKSTGGLDVGGFEVGILPFALLVAKYGPVAAKRIYAEYKARKRKRKAKPKEAEPKEAEAEDDAEDGDNEEGES